MTIWVYLKWDAFTTMLFTHQSKYKTQCNKMTLLQTNYEVSLCFSSYIWPDVLLVVWVRMKGMNEYYLWVVIINNKQNKTQTYNKTRTAQMKWRCKLWSYIYQIDITRSCRSVRTRYKTLTKSTYTVNFQACLLDIIMIVRKSIKHWMHWIRSQWTKVVYILCLVI